MSKFKAVLFDYDDTLVDTYSARLKAAEKAVDGVLDANLDMDAIMKKWAGRPQMDIWMDISGQDQQKSDLMMQKYGDWYWNVTTKEVTIYPGTREVIDEIKASGIALGVVTSKVRLMEAEFGPYGVVVEMERLGLDGVFNVVVGWPDVTESKPAPAPILYALERLGISANDALMVGDSHIDVTASKNAKVSSAGALWGTVAKDLLLEASPDYLLETPGDLRQIVL